MEGFLHSDSLEEEPRKESVPVRSRLQRMANLLAPEQRLLLSVFLFMDVCIICFAFLFLFQKVALPF
ncbi:MAG: hypothetical protein JW929_07040 [Anaerolineales bacterium]|nr:hypothetical protein [Anaerolineales bacterium]